MPLHVTFLWHMHQPCYLDPASGIALLPWVRLHATLNYLHMAELLWEHPRVHAVINLVPSLTDQLRGYAQGTLTDRLLLLAVQDRWSAQEVSYLRSLCFVAPRRFMQQHPRYQELWTAHQRDELDELKEGRDIRDLLVWFHLAWTDAGWLEREGSLRRLIEKGRGFNRHDLMDLLNVHATMLSRVLPLYRALEERGQVELTTSPYYHPILPLLASTAAAHEASPSLPLPNTPLRALEDAAEQVRRAVAQHADQLARPPRGLWPSEGAVSQEALAAIAGQVKWIASDEAILARSLHTPLYRNEAGDLTDAHLLYRPYALNIQPELFIVFRDRLLSDLIGFTYSSWEAADAARDLVSRLQRARERLGDEPHLVSIILDGENPWGEYPRNGDGFLRSLYELLAHHPELRTVTIEEYLQRTPPAYRLERLAAGSWIDGALEVWIGEEAHNRAWTYLSRARQALLRWQDEHSNAQEPQARAAWDDLYISQGSDWFWWYSSRNHSAYEPLYDQLFRSRLASLYQRLSLPIPPELQQPISKG